MVRKVEDIQVQSGKKRNGMGWGCTPKPFGCNIWCGIDLELKAVLKIGWSLQSTFDVSLDTSPTWLQSSQFLMGRVLWTTVPTTREQQKPQISDLTSVQKNRPETQGTARKTSRTSQIKWTSRTNKQIIGNKRINRFKSTKWNDDRTSTKYKGIAVPPNHPSSLTPAGQTLECMSHVCRIF